MLFDSFSETALGEGIHDDNESAMAGPLMMFNPVSQYGIFANKVPTRSLSSESKIVISPEPGNEQEQLLSGRKKFGLAIQQVSSRDNRTAALVRGAAIQGEQCHEYAFIQGSRSQAVFVRLLDQNPHMAASQVSGVPGLQENRVSRLSLNVAIHQETIEAL